ncbi:MAG: rRNA maturation RNase YbeY [Weeksellaceae bacterium]
MINIFGSSRYDIQKKTLKAFAEDVLRKYRVNPSTGVNLVFVGKRKMREIANTYKNEDVALPVLSFSYLSDKDREPDGVLGEVIICYPQAILLAAEREKKVEDTMKQLIEHGLQNIFK